MLFNLRPERHLFQIYRMLLLFSNLGFLGLLVQVFAEIQNLADWRLYSRSNLNQIQAFISCHFNGPGCLDYPNLPAGLINQPYFG